MSRHGYTPGVDYTASRAVLEALEQEAAPAPRAALGVDDPSIDEITAEDLLGDYPAVQYIPPEGAFRLDIPTRLGEAFAFVATLAFGIALKTLLRALRIGDAASIVVMGELVSADYFDLLGVSPQRGRLLTAADNVSRTPGPVAVISDGFWRRAFGDPASALRVP